MRRSECRFSGCGAGRGVNTDLVAGGAVDADLVAGRKVFDARASFGGLPLVQDTLVFYGLGRAVEGSKLK